MGPIGSKVIEVKGQIYVFFSVCSSQVLGLIFTKLGGKAAPDISLRGSFFERSRSYLCFFFLFVPLLLPGPWADLHQTWWEGGGRPWILARGFIF